LRSSRRLDDPALFTKDRAAFDKATADSQRRKPHSKRRDAVADLEELRVAFRSV
jgi:hypothetical protein